MRFRGSIIGAILFVVSLPLIVRAMSAQRFSDVPVDAWFATYVNQAADAGIVDGYKDLYGNETGRFGPENRVTVAEALKIALESAGYDVSRGVGYGHWAAKYFSIALGEHFSVVSDPYLNPDRPALRAEVAALMSDAFHVAIPVPQGSVFTDLKAGDEYAGAVEALANAQVISGDTDTEGNRTGRFRPEAPVNRAETVKIAMAARALYGEPGNQWSSSSYYSSSSSHSSSSSSTGTCGVGSCGTAPGIPNWMCPDGFIAGPSCTRLPDGRCGWLIRQCSSSSSSSSSSRSKQTFDVRYTSTGFMPSFLVIRIGDTVQYQNASGRQMWVQSNPYPTHTDYFEFNQNVTGGTGSTYSFTFQRLGTWGYHNYMKPEHTGVVVVNE
jgi:plastocyanin